MASSSSKSFLLLISVLSIAILLIYSDIAHARNLLETNAPVKHNEGPNSSHNNNRKLASYDGSYPQRPPTYADPPPAP